MWRALAPDVLRRTVDMFMRGYISQQIPITRSIDELVSAGWGYRRSEMFLRFHELEMGLARLPTIRRMYTDRPIPRGFHFRAGPRATTKTYYRVDWGGFLTETGEEVSGSSTVLGLERKSWREIEEKAMKLVARRTYGQDFKLFWLSFEGGWEKT